MPLAGALFHDVGFGEVGGGDLAGGFELAEGEGEAFADAVVVGGEDVGSAEAEDEKHLHGPLADAADLREVRDDVGVGHAADAGEGGDGAVEGFGGEVADGEGLVVGQAGGAELLVGGVEEMLGGGVGEPFGEVVGVVGGAEGAEELAVNGGGGFAVELLIDDGLEQGFKGRGGGCELHGEGAGALDEAGEFGVGGGEGGECGFGGVGRFARALDGAWHGESVCERGEGIPGGTRFRVAGRVARRGNPVLEYDRLCVCRTSDSIIEGRR